MRIIKIGKEKTNDIYKDFKNDPTVSRNHCQIFEDDQGNKFLTDLKSTNGTFVNGNKISEPVLLSRYDIVRAGNSLVKWKDFMMFSESEIENIEEPNISEEIRTLSKKKKKKWWPFILIILSVLFIVLYNLKNETNIEETKLINDVLKKEKLPIKESSKKKIRDVLKNDNTKEKRKIVYPRPKNGYSPYDSYFGKGVYNNSTNNSVSVSAPLLSDIIFLLKDYNSGLTIRNEYIRGGSTYNLTGIPYGTYTFSYFSGTNWSKDISMKKGRIRGGFSKNKSFSKSEKIKDRMNFKTGYYGSVTIKLTQRVNGNLETQRSNEDEFFN